MEAGQETVTGAFFLFFIKPIIINRNNDEGYSQGREQADCDGHCLIIKQSSGNTAHKDKGDKNGTSRKYRT